MASSPESQSPVISKSLLDSIKTPPPNWKPPRRFLFGLGPPWEPNPWECSDSEEEDFVIAASQHAETSECKKIKIDDSLLSSELVAKSRWKSPLSYKKEFMKLGSLSLLLNKLSGPCLCGSSGPVNAERI